MSWVGYLLIFASGFVCGMGTWLLWKSLRFAADLKAARDSVSGYLDDSHRSGVHAQATLAVERCKNRLRWNRNPNPEWLPPLIEEIPKLVREIAAIYHPADVNPLLAPGLSQFSRAVHLTALDVANFLQTRSIGRLIDVSANTAIKTWEQAHKFAQHETVREVGKWYRRLLPVWQVARFKSPVVWATMAVSNVAARTLQPAIVDIVARRAIDLYSGRLGRQPKSTTTPPPSSPNPLPTIRDIS